MTIGELVGIYMRVRSLSLSQRGVEDWIPWVIRGMIDSYHLLIFEITIKVLVVTSTSRRISYESGDAL